METKKKLLGICAKLSKNMSKTMVNSTCFYLDFQPDIPEEVRSYSTEQVEKNAESL